MDYSKIFNKRNEILDASELESIAKFPSSFIDFISTYEIENRKIGSLELKVNIPGREDFVYLWEFLTIKELVRTNTYYKNDQEDEVLISNELFIIANTSASIFICIGTKNEINYGEIYLYGWDLGLIKITDNLDQFIHSLIIQVK